MSLAYFSSLFEYNVWANHRVLNASAEVSASHYLAPCAGLSFGNLHATLVHILVAEVVWLARWQGGLPPEALKDARVADRLATDEIRGFAELRALWATEEAKQREYFAALNEEALEQPLSYRTQYGEADVQSLDQLIGHFVNHGTQFRAEAAVRLTQLGRSPGDLDYIIFLREQRDGRL